MYYVVNAHGTGKSMHTVKLKDLGSNSSYIHVGLEFLFLFRNHSIMHSYKYRRSGNFRR